MKIWQYILIFFVGLSLPSQNSLCQEIAIFQDKITLPDKQFYIAHNITHLTTEAIEETLHKIRHEDQGVIVTLILDYKNKNEVEDWFYYQIIRKTAQHYTPKQEDYYAYTLMKYYLLRASGFAPQLVIAQDQLLLFIQSDDEVFDIPFFELNEEKYICLNAHDYGLGKELNNAPLTVYNDKNVIGSKKFSYKISHLPDFPIENYQQKNLAYTAHGKQQSLSIKVNTQLNTLLNNYPITPFDNYFNIPISKVTLQELTTSFQSKVKGLSQQKGIELILQFCRSAFAYEEDQVLYGKEKRMIAEQTMMSSKSDCDDRAALFYALVKEIYNLPMIVIVYPSHINVAVSLDSEVKGDYITHNDRKYLICEPTPQGIELPVGGQHPRYKQQTYEIAFEYAPQKK